MTEALTLLVAIYALTFLFVIGALALGGRADDLVEHHPQGKVACSGEGDRSIHNGDNK